MRDSGSTVSGRRRNGFRGQLKFGTVFHPLTRLMRCLQGCSRFNLDGISAIMRRKETVKIKQHRRCIVSKLVWQVWLKIRYLWCFQRSFNSASECLNWMRHLSQAACCAGKPSGKILKLALKCLSDYTKMKIEAFVPMCGRLIFLGYFLYLFSRSLKLL